MEYSFFYRKLKLYQVGTVHILAGHIRNQLFYCIYYRRMQCLHKIFIQQFES